MGLEIQLLQCKVDENQSAHPNQRSSEPAIPLLDGSLSPTGRVSIRCIVHVLLELVQVLEIEVESDGDEDGSKYRD